MRPSNRASEPLSVAAFTAAGQPFELMEAVVRGEPCQVFRHAPSSLAQLYVAARAYAGRELAVVEELRRDYGEVFTQAALLAAHLSERGIERGTHVAIAMRNRPEWLVAFIAISALGAVPVLVNSRGAAAELAYSIGYTRCRFV